MNPEEFKNEMIIIREVYDSPEEFHIFADELMCELLRELGYGDGIDIFDNQEKWYS